MAWHFQGITVFQERMGTVEIKLEVSSITADLVCWALILYMVGAFYAMGTMTLSYMQVGDIKGFEAGNNIIRFGFQNSSSSPSLREDL